jgi:hypothetical protein
MNLEVVLAEMEVHTLEVVAYKYLYVVKVEEVPMVVEEYILYFDRDLEAYMYLIYEKSLCYIPHLEDKKIEIHHY